MTATRTPPPAEARATATAQRRYNRQAALFDLSEAAVEPLFGRWRRRLWGNIPAGSRVLEIGVGTGKNMRCYPPSVSVVAVDFSPRMLSRAIRRARKGRVHVQLAMMDAQALALADASFDVVVATFVFCSVPDPVLGLQEVRRVLRPDGRILLLEHVRSRLPVLGRLMDWLNPISVRLQGYNINRDTVGNVAEAGLAVRRADNLLLDIFKLIDGAPAAGRGAG
ncbi:MAG: hypothetical protein A2148_07085 [Chloroflexi bacterium RBG_16_68_14]|nr:MAG: hypothetical protein A2148_07085 [Chloroflexi bacterium RBG_16_68_14]